MALELGGRKHLFRLGIRPGGYLQVLLQEFTLTKEAEGVASKAEALEQRGEVVVREAIINKLLNIQFTLVPYSRDSEPKRLEHIDARGSEKLIDESSREGN